MFCPKCGEHNAEGSGFCTKCGNNLSNVLNNESVQNVDSTNLATDNDNSSVSSEPIQSNVNHDMNDNKKSNLIPIIVIVLVVAAGIFFGISKLVKKDNSSTNSDMKQNTSSEVDTNVDNDSSNSNQSTIDGSTDTTYDKNGDFLMSVEDVFSISGKGTVATGRVLRGTVKVGDKVQVIGLDHEIITTEVVDIQAFRQSMEYADAGNDAGLYLKDVERDDVVRGQVLAKPNSIKAYKKFDADIYFYSTKEGGRATAFFANYRPQFCFRTAVIAGGITLPSGVEMVNPGTNIKLTVELEVDVAMEVGDIFDVRDTGRTAGKGTVTKIY